MISNQLPYQPIKRFDKLPLLEDGDVFRPEPDIINKHFQIMESEGYTNFDEIKEQLLALRLTRQEVEAVITDNQPIPSYEEWKENFQLYCLNQLYSSELRAIESNFEQEPPRTILNKRNPFADVAIKDQSFLYPSKKGYEVLSFTTNKHFIHKETDEGSLYAVIPGFKVSRQKSRERVNTIVATDSVSTVLPTKKENHKIIYI